MDVEPRHVALGILAGSSVLFLAAVWPAIVHPELREPVAPSGEQSPGDALVTLWLGYGGMAYVIKLTSDLVSDPPDDWMEML